MLRHHNRKENYNVSYMSSLAQTRALLIQAGLREPRHARYYVGSRVILAFLGLVGVITFFGVDSFPLLVCVPALGFFVPRLFLMRMIKDRQRRIRLAEEQAANTVRTFLIVSALVVFIVTIGPALIQAYHSLVAK